MTEEQKDALNRVKAAYAANNDVGIETGIYSTNDMRVVIGFMEEQELRLESVKEDLIELKNYLEMDEEVNQDEMALEMVESTLMFLTDNEF